MSVTPYLIVGYPIINLNAADFNEFEWMLNARFASGSEPKFPCIVHIQSRDDTIELEDHHMFVAWDDLKLKYTVNRDKLAKLMNIKEMPVPDNLHNDVVELGEVDDFGIHTALADFEHDATYYYPVSSAIKAKPTLFPKSMNCISKKSGYMLQPALAQKGIVGQVSTTQKVQLEPPMVTGGDMMCSSYAQKGIVGQVSSTVPGTPIIPQVPKYL